MNEFCHVELHLLTGAGRVRSGCGAAPAGAVDPVPSEAESYRAMGKRAFIFPGYPHMDEAEHFGRLVVPHLKTCSLPQACVRVPDGPPATPLAAGEHP